MDKQPKTPARPNRGWLGFLIAAGLAMSLMTLFGGRGGQIGYDELKAKIRGNEVARVVVTASEVRAEPKDEKLRDKGVVWTSGRGEGQELEKLLDEAKVPYRYDNDAGMWGAMIPWLVLFGGMAIFWWFMLRRLRPGAGFLSFGKSKAKLASEETRTTFADVAGVDEAVEELKEIVQFLADPERFRRLGGKIPKGVLLVGPPGTGKTLLARAVAGEAKVPFYQLTGSDFVEMFVGVGAARVRDLFAEAQTKAPAIIFIDELDAIGKARGVGVISGGHDEREQTLNQLLSEMDGFDARKGLIVMAATNRPEILDPALLRPGRFDRQVLVDRPDVRGREAILRVHVRGVTLAPDVDLKKIAQLTPGMAGADLANLVNEAALLAVRRGKEAVTMSELNESIERVMAGLEKKSRRLSDRERQVVAHHEAGHTILAEVLPSADRVHKVSIIPRGFGALGYTMQLPTEERYITQQRELLDKVTVLMGGRAAEEVFFGEISTGATDDLERATEIVRRMIIQYGMGATLGPQAYRPRDEARFLGSSGAVETRLVSDRTAEAIDAEVTALLRRLHDRAIRVVKANRAQAEALAKALLEEEVVEGERLRETLRGAALPAELTVESAA
ncbi:MAG TPA: ATP-dependent zinc metalloprotease FtsH [Haliangiales bacterium]|nr:ATP-dependent zinc metalloprotease FtsH [Haliangiales bacterium]